MKVEGGVRLYEKLPGKEDEHETRCRKIRKVEEIRRINEGNDDGLLEELSRKYVRALGVDKEELKYCGIEKCGISTPVGKLIARKGQAIPQAILVKTMEYIKDLEDRKIIRKSDLVWRNPIRAIEKPDGKGIRLVSNLMGLNDLVEKDPYGLPNIRDIIRATQGSKYFTVLDIKKAFYNIEIVEGTSIKRRSK